MAPFLFIFASCLVLFLLTVVALIRSYLVVVTVENVSMSPTLEHGDRVLALRSWPYKSLHKGHIVLIWPERKLAIGSSLFEVKPYIKRIIGLGGETVTTYLNNITETDYPHQEDDVDDHRNQQIWHIPQEHIFVRGDNRASSLDSLTWGPIPQESVLGVVLMKLPRKALSPPPTPPLQLVHTNGITAGQSAPPFAAQTLSGETVTFDTYGGRAVVFLFIAPSDMCRRVIPVYAAIDPKAAEAGVTIIFVSSTGIQVTRSFVDELNISIPIIVAPRASNPFLHDYNVFGTPFYCFVNEQGKVQSAGYPNLERGEWKVLTESWTKNHAAVAREGK